MHCLVTALSKLRQALSSDTTTGEGRNLSKSADAGNASHVCGIRQIYRLSSRQLQVTEANHSRGRPTKSGPVVL